MDGDTAPLDDLIEGRAPAMTACWSSTKPTPPACSAPAAVASAHIWKAQRMSSRCTPAARRSASRARSFCCPRVSARLSRQSRARLHLRYGAIAVDGCGRARCARARASRARTPRAARPSRRFRRPPDRSPLRRAGVRLAHRAALSSAATSAQWALRNACRRRALMCARCARPRCRKERRARASR